MVKGRMSTRLSLDLDMELYMRFKLHCVRLRTPLQVVLRQLLVEYLDKADGTQQQQQSAETVRPFSPCYSLDGGRSYKLIKDMSTQDVRELRQAAERNADVMAAMRSVSIEKPKISGLTFWTEVARKMGGCIMP